MQRVDKTESIIRVKIAKEIIESAYYLINDQITKDKLLQITEIMDDIIKHN